MIVVGIWRCKISAAQLTQRGYHNHNLVRKCCENRHVLFGLGDPRKVMSGMLLAASE